MIWDLHKYGLQIWIQNAKITLWKNFGQFFRFHRFWSSGPGMQKKIISHILAVIQNIWDLHKFGLQIWIQNAKITLWKNFGQFFRFHRFWSSGPGMQKKACFPVLAVFQNIWDLHKFGLQIWIQNAKITLWKNYGQFFWFHRFWSSGPGMRKKDNFSILVVIQNIWDLHKFGLQIWIQNVRITLSKNFRQFFLFSSILVIMRKKVISQY